MDGQFAGSYRDTYTQTQAALHTDATAKGAPHESAAGVEEERTPRAAEGESPDRALSRGGDENSRSESAARICA